MQKKNLSQSCRALGASIAGLGLFVLCIWSLGLPGIDVLHNINFFWLGIAIICQALQITCVTLRWRLLLLSAGMNITIGSAWKMVAVSTLASMVVPKDLADIGGRGVWLAKHVHASVVSACHLTLCDRLFELFLFALMLPASVVFVMGAGEGAALCLMAATAVAGAGLILLMKNRFFLVFTVLFGLAGRVCSWIPFLRGKIRWTITTPDVPACFLLSAYALTVGKFAVTVLYTLACFRVIDLDAEISVIILILPVTQLAFLFSFAPGGLGILELGWAAVLKAGTALSNQAISLYLIAQRVCVTIAVALCALPPLVAHAVKAVRTDKYIATLHNRQDVE